MRILYFTFMQPSVRFGGGLGVLKSLKALCETGDVDYIGPEFDTRELKEYNLKLSHVYFIDMEKNKTARVRNYFLYGSGSLFCKSWFKAIESIQPSNYDVVYMERTLQGFAAAWTRKNAQKLVVMTHNVEFDFLNHNRSKNKIIDHFFISNIKKNESTCINCADKVIVLTEKDKKRFIDLYGKAEKYTVMPVCVRHPLENGETFQTENPYIFMTGSLWFGPNAEGIMWFLKYVWSEISREIQYDLVIAGKSPNEELFAEASKHERVYLIDSPQKMDPYYRGASIFVAPIFDGAGMKVKIAEAMSYGLPIVATKHALIGYEAVENYVYKATGSDEFIRMIKEISKGGGNISQSDILDAFDLNYSDDAFKIKLRQVLI